MLLNPPAELEQIEKEKLELISLPIQNKCKGIKASVQRVY